ncbi:hypothetical protein BaRGS_00025848 [Batillaria attramentaria]|uniref:Uncharacterized protein n=1 Tax=Batillaria attramentaria TaxID=370345 RepID=A0ABD0K7K5_9CAEN
MTEITKVDSSTVNRQERATARKTSTVVSTWISQHGGKQKRPANVPNGRHVKGHTDCDPKKVVALNASHSVSLPTKQMAITSSFSV